MNSIKNLIPRIESFKRASGQHGLELQGPCPCDPDSRDRFVVWPEVNRWFCRRCGKKGDAIEYLKVFNGLTYKEALAHIGMQDTATLPGKRPNMAEEGHKPDYDLLNTKIVQYADELARRPAVLQWLEQERGLRLETVKVARLGFVPAYKDLPDRLIIPIMHRDKVKGIVFKMLQPHRLRFYEAKGFPKTCHEIGHCVDRPVLVVESILDAWLCWQESQGYFDVIALNGASPVKMPVINTRVVLIATDNDDAGEQASDRLQRALKEQTGYRPEHVIRYKVPSEAMSTTPGEQVRCKDPGELWQAYRHFVSATRLRLKSWVDVWLQAGQEKVRHLLKTGQCEFLL